MKTVKDRAVITSKECTHDACKSCSKLHSTEWRWSPMLQQINRSQCVCHGHEDSWWDRHWCIVSRLTGIHQPNTVNHHSVNSAPNSTTDYTYILNTFFTLCTTNLLSIPRVRTTFASHGFSVAAPTVWNSLPSGIRDSSSTHTFCRILKTHCFQQAFGSPKCLRFGLWLTMCTPKIDLLTYLLRIISTSHKPLRDGVCIYSK